MEKYILAPMEEINDIAFRLLCKKAGCKQTYTGMIHPLTKQKIHLQDKPILQLFCISTKGIKQFIKKYNSKVSGFDFNLGCPAKNAKKHGFGCFLTNIKTIESILKTLRNSTKKPFSIKIRKSTISLKLLKLAEKYCDSICIHPRTQAQGYSGEPDLTFAKKIKAKSKIPVIYSGNVTEQNADKLLETFDAVIMGRQAIGRPNIFSKLTETKSKKITFKDYLKLAEKYKLPFRQIKLQAMNFTKEKPKAKQLRLKIYEIKTLKKLKKIKF